MHTPAPPTRRRGPATWLLLGLTTLLTAALALSALRSVLTAAGVVGARLDGEDRQDLAALGILDEQGLRVSEGLVAMLTTPLAITCLVLVLGLVRWRDWAREGALGLFGLTGLLLLVMSLNGMAQDPPGRHAGLGVLASLALLGVAALTFSPPVRRDFEREEVGRRLRERQAATAARRARTG